MGAHHGSSPCEITMEAHLGLDSPLELTMGAHHGSPPTLRSVTHPLNYPSTHPFANPPIHPPTRQPTHHPRADLITQVGR